MYQNVQKREIFFVLLRLESVFSADVNEKVFRFHTYIVTDRQLCVFNECEIAGTHL